MDNGQPFDIGAIATGGASEAASGLIGMALGAYNDNRQLTQQRHLQNLQIQGQEQLTDYNMGKQLELWKDTSYPAQMEQLKKAGLNPGLLYGQGGGGGQTAAIAQGGTAGGQATQNPGEIQGIMGIGLQSAMLEAQIENIKADTKNKLGDAANKPKVGANLDASTGLLTAQTGNTDADTALTKINTQIAEKQKEIISGTVEEQINAWTEQASILTEQAMQMAVKTNIDRATSQDVIDTVHANLLGAYLENALKKSNIAVNKEQIFKMAQDIAQGWSQLNIQQQGVNVSKTGVANQYELGKASNAIQKNYTEKLIDLGVGEEVIQGVGTILGAFGRGGALQPTPAGPTQVRGFHNR